MRAPPKSQEQKKAERADYMRRWRAERAERVGQNPSASTGAEAVAVSETTAQSTGVAPAEPVPDQKALDAERAAQVLAQRQGLLRNALSGTVQTVADTVQLLALDNSAPHLGKERSDYIADLWAPVLAPYITEKTAQHLPLVLAGGSTAATLFAWAHDYNAHVQRRAGVRLAPVPQPAPAQAVTP